METGIEDTAVKPPSILIIAGKASTVRGTAAFLSRRDYPTYVATTMNEALSFLTEKKPDIVLISANYPHQKIESFPALLEQSFGVETVAFAEDHDRKSTMRAQSMRARHIITGMVSGPSVVMKIRQIEQARNAPEESKVNRSSDLALNDGDSSFVLKGQRSKAQEAALGDLLKVLSNDGTTEAPGKDKEHSIQTAEANTGELSAKSNGAKDSAANSATQGADKVPSSGDSSSKKAGPEDLAGKIREAAERTHAAKLEREAILAKKA
ncbi:MAG: hypothetical protein V4692_03990, partial [Bdellovibrionota bacterium]